MQPIAALRRYPLFNLLTAPQLECWINAGQEMTLADGETVFQQGAVGDWVYLVVEGRVRIVRRSGESGREIPLGVLRMGEVFGEYALLPPHRNTATCRASVPTRLLALPLTFLRPLLDPLGIAGDLKKWLRLHALACYLREQAFLGFMSASTALAYLDHLQPLAFAACQTIQASGLGDDCWYFIKSGRVNVQSVAGQPAGTLKSGDCFGELALLGRETVPVVTAASDTQCLCLSRQVFMPGSAPVDHPSIQSLSPEVSALRKTYPWVGQKSARDCGTAALTMIAQFHALEITAAALQQELPIGAEGVSLAALQRAAENYGFSALPAFVTAENLQRVVLPTIVHYHSGHFVVLYEFGSEGALVGDPSSGIIRLSQEAFRRNASGNLLLVRRRFAGR